MKMNAIGMILLVVAAVTQIGMVLGGCDTLVRNIHFNNNLVGAYTEESLEQDFDGYQYFKGREAASIRSYEGSKYLCLKMKKGCVSTHNRRCGMVGRVPIKEVPDTVTLEYTVRFGNGFDWNKGGKLLGLCSDKCPTGCSKVKKPSDGFSVRAMWGSEGMIYLYSYAMGLDTGGKCGNDTMPSSPMYMKSGRDYRVRLIARMNKVGKSNGKLELWVSNKRLVAIDDLQLRSSARQGVDSLLFHTFYGGNNDEWAAPRNEDIMYKNIRVYTGDCEGDKAGAAMPKWSPPPGLVNVKGAAYLPIKTRDVKTWGDKFCVWYTLANPTKSVCSKYVVQVVMNPKLGPLARFLGFKTVKRKGSQKPGTYTLIRNNSKYLHIKPGEKKKFSLCVSTEGNVARTTIAKEFIVYSHCDHSLDR